MLGRLRKELEGSDVLAKRYQFHPAQHRDGVEVKIAGRKLVDFSSWDVLGLRSKRQVKWAVQSEVENGGLGSYSPRLVAGTTLPHLHCEQRIAQFLGEEGALLFSSKNQAVLSLVTAICSEKDVVLFDETMRSPIADAAFLVNAGAVPYPHNNLDALHDRLRESHKATNRLIIQEYLSPVSGLVCDLAGLISLAETHDAYIVL
ncbi:MAG: aminotransferase class I/II-fold pyridoxal phosphate-dependent enzyme, partial [Deltaproteobacteria bacterium]|nr:aminotransferase class I/II-fold pyridoxal phosphate-dependent enzyme [Deltaproteobacteria bacterium]